VKLGELRKLIREDPNERNCHICAWTATPRRAVWVYRAPDRGEWFDCGEHEPEHPNGEVETKTPLRDWLRNHNLLVGEIEPEAPEHDEPKFTILIDSLRKKLAKRLPPPLGPALPKRKDIDAEDEAPWLDRDRE